MLPLIGASMYDAGRTRENDTGCCCDSCGRDSETCGMSWIRCENDLADVSADAMFEAQREAA